MASCKKIKKLKNSYCWRGALKEKSMKIKRVLFYTPSLRRILKYDMKNQND